MAGDMSAGLVWKDGAGKDDGKGDSGKGDNGKAHQVPWSERFGDVYFSAIDGLAESRHVFLDGNGLPGAWAGRRDFTIAETGFGTGLNFCAVADLWRRERAPGALLHYFSVEAFPLATADLAKALAPWPGLGPVPGALIAAWPEPVPGMHRLHFAEWGIVLTLAFAEAGAALATARARVDAWFLDGFAPSRNPDMWRPEVLSAVGRLTVPGGSLATFTAAGAVRRGLAEAGFEVRKVPGFGRKREMVVARLRGDVSSDESRAGLEKSGPEKPGPEKTGKAPAAPLPRRCLHEDRDSVAIIGAGIAGLSMARALHRRGVGVTIYDPAGPGGGASGNPFALVMPRMDAGDAPEARFYAAAYRFALQSYGAVKPCKEGGTWYPAGVLVLLRDRHAEQRARKAQALEWHPAHRALWLDPGAAGEAAGVPLSSPALFYPEAGLVDTAALFAAWAGDIPIVPRKVARIMRNTAPGGGNGVTLFDAAGAILQEARTVVLAAGAGNAAFAESDWLPLAPVRGQLSILPASPAFRPGCVPGRVPGHILSWGGYLAPVPGGGFLLGATHDAVNGAGDGGEIPVLEADHRRNHAGLPEELSGLLAPPVEGWRGRARLRAVTPDRFPLFGAVPDKAALRAAFGRTGRMPRHLAHYGPEKNGEMPVPDLLVLGGLGSRGFVTAPLAAEVLAARLYGEVWPVGEECALAGDPLRFVLRALRRGRLGEFLG